MGWSNVGSKNSYGQTVETVSIEPYGHLKKIAKNWKKKKAPFIFLVVAVTLIYS